MKVDPDLDNDLLVVTYDPKKVDREKLLQTIRNEGFEPEVKGE